MPDSSVVIVGAGQGGFQLAASLRQNGHAGRIILVGEEPGVPYQRPPLSKAYLKGDLDLERLSLRPEAFYRDQAVELVAGLRVEEIERAERRVRLADGRRLRYEHLVLATGARNRPLAIPGAELDGVVHLRTVVDAVRLRERLDGAQDVVVIGAGFIGLEFAAVAAAKGKGVQVVELANRPMARAVTPAISGYFAAWHAAAGVQLHHGVTPRRILGHGGRIAGVELADGRTLRADLVLVGIGVLPCTELAQAAGLDCANGIVVDDRLRTEDPAISAIGDCANFPSRHASGGVRLESVQNAVDQARCVAARLAGTDKSYDGVPWFWSDQGDQKLQMVGICTGHDLAVVRGRPSDGRFSVFCFSAGRLIGIESVNQPTEHMVGRKLLAIGGGELTPDQAADESFDLKRCVAA